MGVAEGKSAVTPWVSFDSVQARLDLKNEIHYVSELPLDSKIQTVKVEKTKKYPISLPKQMFFHFFNFDGLYF